MSVVAGGDATRRRGVPGTPSARLPFPQPTTVNFVFFWLVVLMLLVNLARTINVISGGVSGVTRLILLALLVLAATSRTSPVRAIGRPGIFFMAAIVLHVVIGTTVAVYHDEHFRSVWYQSHEVAGLLIVAAVASGVHDVASRIGIERLLTGVLAILTFASSSMLMNAVVLYIVQGGGFLVQYRSTGVYSDPNQGALFACLTVALGNVMLILKRRQALAIVAMAVGVLAVVVTASRTGLAILGVVSLVNIAYGYKIRGPAFAVSAILVAITVFGAVALSAGVADDSSTVLSRLLGWSADTRRLVWSHGLSKILEAPLWGHGINSFYLMTDFFTTRCLWGGGPYCGVHNQYLLLIGEAGVLPLLYWLLFIYAAFKKCSWMPDTLAKAVGGIWILAYAVFGLSVHTLLVEIHYFFPVGFACGLLTWKAEAAPDGDLHRNKPLE